jgi:hypothetical protein
MNIYWSVIQLSGRFIYPGDFSGNQSVQINEAPLFIDGTTAEYVVCFQYFADWSAWKYQKDQEQDTVWEKNIDGY